MTTGNTCQGLSRQGCKSTAKVELIGIVNDNKGCLNATSCDWIRLRMTKVSSLLARFLVHDFFSFKYVKKLLLFSFSCLFFTFFNTFSLNFISYFIRLINFIHSIE